MNDAQRLNFAKSLNNFASEKIKEALELAGKTLPATVVSRSGKMVTVSFSLTNIPFTLPQVTIPLFGPEYIRYPMQPGDKGIVIPADAYIGGMSGQGGGTADLTQPPNLSALTYLPISNTEWSDVDGEVLTMYGPEGVTIRDRASNSTFLLTPQSVAIATPDSFTVTVGGTVLSLTQGMWQLTGQAGKLQDASASTSPAIMQAGWSSLVTWLNGHRHSDDGSGIPVSPFSGDITE